MQDHGAVDIRGRYRAAGRRCCGDKVKSRGETLGLLPQQVDPLKRRGRIGETAKNSRKRAVDPAKRICEAARLCRAGLNHRFRSGQDRRGIDNCGGWFFLKNHPNGPTTFSIAPRSCAVVNGLTTKLFIPRA